MGKEDKNIALDEAFAGHIPFDPVEPEKNLLRAILLSAMHDIKKQGNVGKEARLFFLDSSEEYVFSFRSICHILSVDPKSILSVIDVEN